MGSGWVSLLCHVVWGFGVGSELGWAASCRHTHPKKSGAITLNGSAELRRLRALGGPKLAAPTVTHYREETGSYHLASFGPSWQSLFEKSQMPLAAFQQNWLLWMTPEWGSKSDPKIGFADRASPVFCFLSRALGEVSTSAEGASRRRAGSLTRFIFGERLLTA